MKLNLRLIVPGPGRSPDSRTILLTDDDGLPAAAAEGDEDEAAVVGVAAFLREAWGLPVPVLETHPRWEAAAKGEPIPTLVTTEPAPEDWVAPAGLAFRAIPDEPGDLPEALGPRAAELLQELRTASEPPALRPRWARRGWHARASAWMVAAAAGAGRPLSGEPRPFYLRGISALLRAPTDGPDLFLKAVFPHFHAEPALTALLAERAPRHLPPVVAIEPDEGWLLVEDVGARLIGEEPESDRPAALELGARTIVEIQSDIARRPDDIAQLLAAGAPHRPLAQVADAFAAAVGPAGVAFEAAPLDAARRDQAMAAVRAAVPRVDALGLHETVVHGDFHSGNAVLVDDRVVIIDWSDAAIANPAIDLVTWISWSKDRTAEIDAAVTAWVDAWSTVVDRERLVDAIDDILIAGAAYQVISYDGIVRNLEPNTRYTMAGGAEHFLEAIEQRRPGAAGQTS